MILFLDRARGECTRTLRRAHLSVQNGLNEGWTVSFDFWPLLRSQSTLAGNQFSFILVLKERHEWRRKISWKWAGTGGDTAIYGSWGPRGGRYGLRWPRFTASVPALIFPRLLVFGNLSWTLKNLPESNPKKMFWGEVVEVHSLRLPTDLLQAYIPNSHNS